MIYIFLIVSILITTTVSSFQTLTDLQKYAQKYPEAPHAVHQNWFDADYTEFYKNTLPHFLTDILNFLSPSHSTHWSPEQFKQLIDDITAKRTSRQLTGNIVTHIHVPPQSRFLIWGDVHGAFHSLVYGLTDLYHQGILDINLTIIKPDYYFVFNGNLINRSPYSLETLHLILLLMKQNPEHIFYIKGNHEQNQYWHNFNLKHELIVRAQKLSHEPIPFSTSIDAFFNTLPAALYISSSDI